MRGPKNGQERQCVDSIQDVSLMTEKRYGIGMKMPFDNVAKVEGSERSAVYA